MSVLQGAVVENTPDAWSARAQERDPWSAAGWTRNGQLERMLRVVAELDPAGGESILDYGCGTGELARHLAADVDYVGYDWAPGMIARARVEHPDNVFMVVEPNRSFDLVAAIGPFNLPGDKLLSWAAIRRLWDNTRRALAVSLYAGTDERCLTYSDEEVSRFASSESYYWTVERWRHNDLLMVLRR
jgi:SAM-dependent methyltransferase